MRSYLIDELSSAGIKKITGFLKKNAVRSNLDEIYWIRIPEGLLSETQMQHLDCRPHVFAAELGPGWIKLEFFVRSSKNMRCTCQGYCTYEQTAYIIKFATDMIKQLGIRT
jgi:hypothetical protein